MAQGKELASVLARVDTMERYVLNVLVVTLKKVVMTAMLYANVSLPVFKLGSVIFLSS